MTMRSDLLMYLQYVHNTGGVNVVQFDDDWDPIGPMVRRELVPTYLTEGSDGSLTLTAEGEAERVKAR